MIQIKVLTEMLGSFQKAPKKKMKKTFQRKIQVVKLWRGPQQVQTRMFSSTSPPPKQQQQQLAKLKVAKLKEELSKCGQPTSIG